MGLILFGTALFCLLWSIIELRKLKHHSNDIEEKIKEQRKRLIWDTNTIDRLLNRYKDNPTDFEHYMADVYRLLGYKCEVTSATGDGGKDILMSKDGTEYVVEVKLYSKDNTIGREKIQKLHSAMIDCKANKAIFITTSDFKKTAVDYAAKHGIDLINGDKLIELIWDAYGENDNELGKIGDVVTE